MFYVELSWRVTFPPIITVRGTISLPGSSLIPENREVQMWGSRRQQGVPAGRLTVVERDGVQTGEQLPLVLVDSLHLDVEHGVGIDGEVVVLSQEGRELYFVLLRERESETGSERGSETGSETGSGTTLDRGTGTFLTRAMSRMNASSLVNLRTFLSCWRSVRKPSPIL